MSNLLIKVTIGLPCSNGNPYNINIIIISMTGSWLDAELKLYDFHQIWISYYFPSTYPFNSIYAYLLKHRKKWIKKIGITGLKRKKRRFFQLELEDGSIIEFWVVKKSEIDMYLPGLASIQLFCSKKERRTIMHIRFYGYHIRTAKELIKFLHKIHVKMQKMSTKHIDFSNANRIIKKIEIAVRIHPDNERKVLERMEKMYNSSDERSGTIVYKQGYIYLFRIPILNVIEWKADIKLYRKKYFSMPPQQLYDWPKVELSIYGIENLKKFFRNIRHCEQIICDLVHDCVTTSLTDFLDPPTQRGQIRYCGIIKKYYINNEHILPVRDYNYKSTKYMELAKAIRQNIKKIREEKMYKILLWLDKGKVFRLKDLCKYLHISKERMIEILRALDGLVPNAISQPTYSATGEFPIVVGNAKYEIVRYGTREFKKLVSPITPLTPFS